MKILLAWFGFTDRDASNGVEKAGDGPIGQAVSHDNFDRIVILSNLPESDDKTFCEFLSKRTSSEIGFERTALTSPMNFGEVYEAATKTIQKVLDKYGTETELVYHLSPGTSAMAAVWILISNTRFPAELIASTKEGGVYTVSLPFEISAEYIPDLLRKTDKRLEGLSAGVSEDISTFGEIVFRSKKMKQVVEVAKRVALHRVPVLIEGESGTGKELFANFIRKSGLRKDKPFVVVNCGAIPSELIESELFGHKKGAFSGADQDRRGHFAEADGGTIFLDEVGELPLNAQVKLLRVLQENEVMPVGSSQIKKIDVRVISATNRSLVEEVGKGRFREDLFYRLAVFVVSLPPLREREGDIILLANAILEKINKENLWTGDRKLTPGAKNVLLRHQWRGNVRELENTMIRAAIFANGTEITKEDVEQAFFLMPDKGANILERPLGNGFNLPDLLSEVSRHYLIKAMDTAHSNKTEAASLLGLPSYQTLSNWLEKYDVPAGK